jgi:hypothetical protein
MGTFTYESIAYRFKNPSIDGNLDLLTDGAIIKIAADDDLQLTHSGSVGDITCSTGALDINAGTVNIKDEASSETMASFVSDGAVTINHDNSTVFNTVSGGCAVTGTLAVSSTSTFTGAISAVNGIFTSNTSLVSSGINKTSGDFIMDVAGDIFLDSDDGNVVLRDSSSVQFGALSNTSGNLIIKSGSTTAATFSGANVTFAGTLASGAITSSGDVTAFSDMRIKHDIETIEGALAKVSDMRGVYFKRNNGEAGTGVIAQEVENILPEVVKDGEYKSVAYGNMVGILIEAIKELKAEVEKLKESK